MGYMPINAVTRKPYNGGNVNTLTSAAERLNGLNDPRWLTFLQAQELGLKVKKGSKGTKIEFWKTYEPKQNQEQQEQQETSTAKKTRLVKKTYTVFHASQVEGMPDYKAIA